MSEDNELVLLICSSSCMLVLCILIAGIFFVYMSKKWTSKKKKELSDRFLKDNLFAKGPEGEDGTKQLKLDAFLCHVSKNNLTGNEYDSAEKNFDFLRSDYAVAYAKEIIELISKKHSYTYTKKNLDSNKGLERLVEKVRPDPLKFRNNVVTKAGCKNEYQTTENIVGN